MNIAIVGGGINGVMTALACAASGHEVQILERDQLMSATSSASTKLIHGGLRYLELGAFKLVRESLRERAWWLRNATDLAEPIRLFLPVTRTSHRSARMIRLGLTLYDVLAGSDNIAPHRSYSREQFLAEVPELKPTSIRRGFHLFDVQMDNYALGMWAAGRARRAGVRVVESTEVISIRADGTIDAGTETRRFDVIVNAAGPWSSALLTRSGIESRHKLDLVRGSHLILQSATKHAFILEHPLDGRVCFILPWKGRTLVGTTEVRQSIDSPIQCTSLERDYLLDLYNAYFAAAVDERDVVATFAGVRPLLKSHLNPNRASREFAVDRSGRVLTIFGGKWTTSHLLGEHVAGMIDSIARE